MLWPNKMAANLKTFPWWLLYSVSNFPDVLSMSCPKNVYAVIFSDNGLSMKAKISDSMRLYKLTPLLSNTHTSKYTVDYNRLSPWRYVTLSWCCRSSMAFLWLIHLRQSLKEIIDPGLYRTCGTCGTTEACFGDKVRNMWQGLPVSYKSMSKMSGMYTTHLCTRYCILRLSIIIFRYLLLHQCQCAVCVLYCNMIM